jgi:hypothetical protein
LGITGGQHLNPLHFLHIFSLLALASCAGGPTKLEVDDEVRRQCAVDGGIKVYETVKLPADMFNQWGQPNFYRPTQKENALGPGYIFAGNLDHYRKENPVMIRWHFSVRRKSDGKLLGESISYGRGGGDLPGPWEPSSYSCPEIAGDITLLTKIFIAQ